MWKRFVNSTFVRNSAVLMSGNILGQAISLLFHLLLCRIYSPDDFGAFAVFMSYAGFMTIIATGGYHYAILLPDDDRTLGNVMKLCACCVATTSILSLLLLMPAEIFLLPGYYDNGTADMFWLLPVYVASYGVWKIMEYWHVRQSNYRLLSAYQLSQNLASSVIKSARHCKSCYPHTNHTNCGKPPAGMPRSPNSRLPATASIILQATPSTLFSLLFSELTNWGFS